MTFIEAMQTNIEYSGVLKDVRTVEVWNSSGNCII